MICCVQSKLRLSNIYIDIYIYIYSIFLASSIYCMALSGVVAQDLFAEKQRRCCRMQTNDAYCLCIFRILICSCHLVFPEVYTSCYSTQMHKCISYQNLQQRSFANHKKNGKAKASPAIMKNGSPQEHKMGKDSPWDLRRCC